jgi:transposase
MSDATGLAEVMLGLDGFRVLGVAETADELVITIESTATTQGCVGCGSRAVAHDRRPTEVRDLACFGRPVRLRVLKRR